MLYLIKCKVENNIYYKIGYSTNIKSRLNSYKTHNPELELLGIVAGEKQDEKDFHNKLSKYRKGRTEWFYDNDEILDLWNEYYLNHPINDSEDSFYLEYFYKYIEFFEKKDFSSDLLDGSPYDVLDTRGWYIIEICKYEDSPVLFIYNRNTKKVSIIPIDKIEKAQKDGLEVYKVNDVIFLYKENRYNFSCCGIGTDPNTPVLKIDSKWESILEKI